MSGISEERIALIKARASKSLTDLKDRRPISYDGWIARLDTITGDLSDMATEIGRLRAENAELRASYDRVEKYAADLRAQIDATD